MSTRTELRLIGVSNVTNLTDEMTLETFLEFRFSLEGKIESALPATGSRENQENCREHDNVVFRSFAKGIVGAKSSRAEDLAKKSLIKIFIEENYIEAAVRAARRN